MLVSETSASVAPGYSLPQSLYTSDASFRTDLGFLRRDMWLLVDHASRIPKVGDFFTFEIGADSVIILRDKDDRIKAFHNVCRHRGSRICSTGDGHASRLTCPYHSWTYGLDGRLIAARDMHDDFVREDHGLIPVSLGECEGLVFINMAANPPCFEAFSSRLRPIMAPYSLARTKVAARLAMPNAANWKLVVENFFECYHCQSAHPLLWSIHDPKKMLAYGAGAGSSDGLGGDYDEVFNRWVEAETAAGRYSGNFADDIDSAHFQSGGRLPIGRGHKTESYNGEPVAPSLLSDGSFDGAQSYAIFNPLGMILMNSDHALAYRFTPRSPQITDIEGIFLVREDAIEGKDYDIDSLMRFWTVTLTEDKVITEHNQAGVNSSAYRPGPYSKHEKRISDLVQWYVARSGAASDINS